MGKVKRAKSKPPKFEKCKCVERTVKGYCNSVQQCPHIHFKSDGPNRDELGHNEYLNFLCTPKGYRWPPFTGGEEGEEDEEDVGERGIGKRLICQGQKVRKADRAYVHNFLAEVWALLTPEMVNRLKEMLQNEFKMSPEEARKFIDKQRELNIERSTSVSLYKKPRKLNDGTVVWDSVVKQRKKTTAECSKFPKYTLGLRNGWIKEFSNMLSSKASNYMLETMCAERTSRQQEIAQTLLNRFNGFLEQEASIQNPKTQTHKTMVMMADKLSIWLDKNVKVSKSVGTHLRRIEEEKQKKRLKDEKERREQERRDRKEKKKMAAREEEEKEKKKKAAREEEEKEKKKKAAREEEEKEKKMAAREEEEKREKLAEAKSATEVMRQPSKTQSEPKGPEPENKEPMEDQVEDEDVQETGSETGDDTDKKDERKLGDGGQGGEPVGEPDQGYDSIPPSNDIADGAVVGEPSTDEDEVEYDQQINQEELQNNQEVLQNNQKGQVDEADALVTDKSRDSRENIEGVEEKTSSQKIKEANLLRDTPPESTEPDQAQNSELRELLNTEANADGESNAGGESNADGAQLEKAPSEGTLSTQPAPDVQPEDSDTPYKSFGDSNPPSSESEYSDNEEISAGIEPSKDSETLVAELLGSTEEREDTEHVDDEDDAVENRTNRVLEEVAEMMAASREEHSPLQEAIKDIMEKELEERLGDKNVEAIDKVAGRVATWVDKMVERVGEEYGERSPSRVRSASPPAVSLPKSTSGVPVRPGTVPVASHSPVEPARYSPMDVPQIPARHSPVDVPQIPARHSPVDVPQIRPPEGLGKRASDTTVETFTRAPVTQKPKGPIFALRKVDIKNIFNVEGPITNTKAKRKIRQARGQSSNRASEESLDIVEWAEWAGLVSDVGQNWAKWIEGVAQGAIVQRPDHNNDSSLSHDAKKWKTINKELKREGDVWMGKAMRNRKNASR